MRGPSPFLRLHLPAHSPLLSCVYKPPQLPRPALPFLWEHYSGGGWEQVHSGGAFPGPVFPCSRWNFQRATGPRHWTPACSPPPCRRANITAPGAVPGNSSISLSPLRLQETETQSPPLQRGPADRSPRLPRPQCPGAGLGGPLSAWARHGADPRWASSALRLSTTLPPIGKPRV